MCCRWSSRQESCWPLAWSCCSSRFATSESATEPMASAVAAEASMTQAVREQLIALLDGHGAHMTFEEAVARFPDEAINQRPLHVEYTPWHIVEHLRLTQYDILEYVRNPAWVSPPWPVGY